MLRPGKENRRK